MLLYPLGSIGIVALGGFFWHLFLAPVRLARKAEAQKTTVERERDEAQRQLAAPAEPADPLADRLEELAAEGKELADRVQHDRNFTQSARQDAVARWIDRAEFLLQAETQRYVTIFRSWQEGPRPESRPLPPGVGRADQAWQLGNHVSALRDIALRVRAQASEDIGPDTARRARLKDILLAADQRRELLQEWLQHEEDVSREEVFEWDQKVRD